MIGKRIYPDSNGEMIFSEGDYGKDPRDGHWYGRPPGGHLGNFTAHEVVEHADGTITVSPSILINPIGEYHNPAEKTWHGYLEKGIWREC